LSLLLSDAADERLIVANPIRARRRGRRRSDRRVERMWATPSEVLAVADNAARLPIGGSAAALLIVTAAWTGVRWGEIAALQRDNTHLEDGVIVPIIGAMIELGSNSDRPRPPSRPARSPCP
jgi:integrase